VPRPAASVPPFALCPQRGLAWPLVARHARACAAGVLAVGSHVGRTQSCGFLGFGTCRVYSHASVIQKQIKLRICVRGRARCGR
jgi:hypothetical protein